MICERCGKNFFNSRGECPVCNFIPSMVRTAPAMMPRGHSPAGFWIRFFAYVIDLLVFGLLAGVVGIVLILLIAASRASAGFFTFMAIMLGLAMIYKALWESSALQATPGNSFSE